jgi:sortase A
MGRFLRISGALLILAGLLMLTWAFVVWRWEDPFTRFYTEREQRKLESSYERRIDNYERLAVPEPEGSMDGAPPTPRASLAWLRRTARAYRSATERGDAVGRLVVPRLDVDMIVVNGTDSNTLKKGPGRYAGRGSHMPG